MCRLVVKYAITHGALKLEPIWPGSELSLIWVGDLVCMGAMMHNHAYRLYELSYV